MREIAGTLPEPKHQRIRKRPMVAVSAMAPVAHIRPVKTTETKLEAATPAKAKTEKKKTGALIASWWPVGVGIFLSGFAPEWFSMFSQAGIWGVRLAFPLVLVATQGHIGLSEHTALYLQLPIEGLVTKLSLDRGMSLKLAAMQLVLIHLVSAFVLWLITFAGQ
jgi:hypothetical protein